MMYSKVPEGWTKCKIGEIVEVLTDYVANGSFAAIKENVSYIDSDGYAVLLRLQDYSNNFKGEFIYINRESYEFLNKSKVFPGDIVISNVGARCGLSFRAPKLDKPMSLAPNSILLRTNQNDDYIFQFLNSGIGQGKIDMIKGVSAQPKFNKTDFKNIEIMLPALKEQEKIAKILSTWDSAIEKQEQLIEKKKEFKKGLMQNLYSKGTKKEKLVKSKLGEVPESWNIVKAKEVFKSVSIKNNENEELLSVTQDKGTIPRSQLEGNVVMPEGSTRGYKLVVPNNFIISLRSFQGGLEISKHRGIISPAYTVLENKIEICHDYFKYYFKKEEFISRLNGAIVGIRDGKQISYADFGEMFLPVPSLEEQIKIAEILMVADKEIELLEKELEVLKLQKKGLMQRLLTGEVRVKV